jgi:hypothetical protein
MIFTPPTNLDVPPVSVADTSGGPATAQAQPAATALFKYYKPRPRGVAVFKMSDGTYRMNEPVAGLSVPGVEPYPAIPEFSQNGDAGVVNDALGQSWYAGTVTVQALPQPTVVTVYYGGHSYPVSSTEAAALTAAGFGAYLS